MDSKATDMVVNNKAAGSLGIGILTIIGLFLFKEGSLLSIVGLLLGVISLKETKKYKEKGRSLGLIGIVCNLIGFIGFVILFNINSIIGSFQ
ncbi:MAG: hypothetical protein ACK4M9_03790 [Anaerobacillus sp.]|uniref:hypothetical protein n=1 Tax=Anaerobacillus sp. TaxID=1872506 RepID=UPI0039187ED0